MKCVGLVLCGGRSLRIGRSKALLKFGSETMLGRVVRLLLLAVDEVVVVAASQQAAASADQRAGGPRSPS